MNSKKKEIWIRVKSNLKASYSPEEIDLWFSGTELSKLGDTFILINVPNRFVASWIEEHYLERLNEITREELGQKVSVRLVVSASENYPQLPTPLDPSLTFDNFIIEPSNKFAYHCVKNLLITHPSKSNPLLVFGNSGVGKTHLLCAAANFMLKKNICPCYLSSQFFTRGKNLDTINEARDSWEALLLDDIHLISGNHRAQGLLINLFDYFYENNLPVLFTSRVPPRDIPDLDKKLFSRLTSCLIASLGPLGQDTIAAILSQEVKDTEVHVPNDVLFFLASSGKDLKELKEDLSRIVNYLSIRPTDMDISTAKGIVLNRPYEPKPGSIKELVAQFFDLSPNILVSDTKNRKVTHARQVAMYLCRKLTTLSLKEIAAFYGRKDHSTIIYAINKIEKKKKEDPDLNKILEWLISNFS